MERCEFTEQILFQPVAWRAKDTVQPIEAEQRNPEGARVEKDHVLL